MSRHCRRLLLVASAATASATVATTATPEFAAMTGLVWQALEDEVRKAMADQ